MFLSTDSDRDEPPSMLCKSASRDGSIPSGIDLFNSDLAGMPLSLLCYSLLYIQYICNNVAIVFNYLSINDNHCVAFTFYYIILSIIVMYLHHYLHQVFKCIFIEHGNII